MGIEFWRQGRQARPGDFRGNDVRRHWAALAALVLVALVSGALALVGNGNTHQGRGLANQVLAHAGQAASFVAIAALNDSPPRPVQGLPPAGGSLTAQTTRQPGGALHLSTRRLGEPQASLRPVPGQLTHTARPRPPALPTRPVHTLQAWVTGYDLYGITATGAPTGPGICAVDPTVIPLGARITVDGHGKCVAADTGPAVVGTALDMWVPDYQTALNLTGWHTIHWE